MSITNIFNIPPALLETIRKMNAEENEYQMKVKALLKKRGFTSIGQMSPEEKKDFFNTLDAMHKAKDEEVKPDVAKSFPASGVKKHTAPKGVSTMPKDKEKAKGQPAGSLKKEEVELEEGKVKELMMDISSVASKMRKNKTLEPFAGKFVTAAKKSLNIKKSLEDVLPDYISGAEITKLYKEEVELEEGKSGTGYELYHKDFSSAMAHAYDFAKKKYNIEIDPFDIDRNVAMGPRKPSSGKANAYRLLDKTGKKAIQVQVTNLDNKRYELNMYKEDVDLEEANNARLATKGEHQKSLKTLEKMPEFGAMSKSLKRRDQDAEYDKKKNKEFIQSLKRGVKKEDLDLEESGGPVVYKKGDDHIEKYGDEKFAVYKNGKKTNFYKSIDDAKAALKEDKTLPFTPDKPKKNPGVVPGKYGAGPSIAKHLAKMAMKKQMNKNKPVKEAESSGTAVNVNQSKRAAISMQMAQLKMQQSKEREALMKKKQSLSDEVEFQFDESFTPKMLDTLHKEYSTINAIDPASDGYKKLIKMLDGLSDQNLKSLAASKIKFVSGLAQNRVNRRGIKEEQIDEYDSKGGVYQHRGGTYGKAKGVEYGDTDFDQENKMQKTLSKVKKAVKKGANQNRRTDTKLYKEEESTNDKGEIKNSKKQTIKKGDTLSGKKETITIEPELKDK